MSVIHPAPAVAGPALRTLGAVCLVLGPVAFAVAEYSAPGASPGDPAAMLAAIGEHSVGAATAIVATLLSAFFFIAGICLLAGRRFTRGRVLVPTGIGLVLWSLLSNTLLLGLNVAFIAMADPSLDRGQMSALMRVIGGSPLAPVALSGHDVLVVAFVALGVGFWRAGLGPRWAGAAIALCGLVDLAGGFFGEMGDLVGSILSNGLMIAGFAAEGWFLAREATRAPAEAVAIPVS
ncbi:hypothetical protein [Microbacterium sp. 22242]|uniref:hypothetical protein n=1 Tax=Microbacterium sp. 22242 TaxID=3453896 RepID=UPI003F86011D